MKQMKLKDILTPTLALFLICLIATVLLALTNSVTAKTIDQNAAETANAARSEVLEAAAFTEETEEPQTKLLYCAGQNEAGETVGYVFTATAKGYGGDVKVMVGYDLTGTITGFTILDCSNETPGLGQNSKKPEFMGRFPGKSGELTVDKYSNEGQNIQAITAATITSKAVVKAVNTATEAFQNLTGGASKGREKIAV